MIARLKLASLVDFFLYRVKCVQTIAGKMIKIIKRPQLHFVLEAKRDLDLVRENEEKFRFCPSEKNMDKLLGDLPPFTYNTIVKYVRNAGKNIQHSLISSNFHKPLLKYKSY